MLSWLVEDKGRVGRKGGKGYYEYGEDGKPTRIWPGISERIEVKVKECPPELKTELTKRYLFRQCIEVARCFEEGVITDPRDADVGSILAWGFAPYSGGCISYIDSVLGHERAVRRRSRSSRRHLRRALPPEQTPARHGCEEVRRSTNASARSRRRQHRLGKGRSSGRPFCIGGSADGSVHFSEPSVRHVRHRRLAHGAEDHAAGLDHGRAHDGE